MLPVRPAIYPYQMEAKPISCRGATAETPEPKEIPSPGRTVEAVSLQSQPPPSFSLLSRDAFPR